MQERHEPGVIVTHGDIRPPVAVEIAGHQADRVVGLEAGDGEVAAVVERHQPGFAAVAEDRDRAGVVVGGDDVRAASAVAGEVGEAELAGIARGGEGEPFEAVGAGVAPDHDASAGYAPVTRM